MGKNLRGWRILGKFAIGRSGPRKPALRVSGAGRSILTV